ncbi:MAG TPA: porin PorA family protein [Gemmatimonadaceae bacterium]|jgi:hypothetical protein|nr:porin PorA family protein [Gemmatimonadaceae bacterium]
MRRSYVVAAIALAAFAAVWHFSVGSRWTRRVPRNAVFTTQYVGTQTNADPKTGIVPERDALSTYERVLVVKDASDWPRSLILEDTYSARNIETGLVDFVYTTNETIDPETGALADGPHKGQIVLFPRNVQQQAYTMRSNYIPGLVLKFSGVSEIGGLDTYMFSYQGPIEYGAIYAGTPDVPGIKLLPGQDIRCADDNFYYRVWVEPRTGTQVQVEEGCLSGDFVYDKATGKKVSAVDRWNGVTAGSNLTSGLTEIYNARRVYLSALYLPEILLTGSLAVLAIGLLRRNTAIIA